MKISHFFCFTVSHNLKDCTTTTAPSLLLVDARSYTAAFANRAKGGGCEYQGNHYWVIIFNLFCFKFLTIKCGIIYSVLNIHLQKKRPYLYQNTLWEFVLKNTSMSLTGRKKFFSPRRKSWKSPRFWLSIWGGQSARIILLLWRGFIVFVFNF